MRTKSCALLVGAVLGAVSGTLAYSFLKQKRSGPFKEVNQIRSKYAEQTVNETQIEADKMLSEGGLAAVAYENQKQEI
ncbi:hypothetical protein [Listeria sp. PSOL-1]|uniref:hypothetical protein n=1 Tax=Listeria sp. PSOL-1 TaxID=1844999 RepID=UPI0013D19961|nr:hypothetical protein [Listeria sp. PSOL-1]